MAGRRESRWEGKNARLPILPFNILFPRSDRGHHDQPVEAYFLTSASRSQPPRSVRTLFGGLGRCSAGMPPLGRSSIPRRCDSISEPKRPRRGPVMRGSESLRIWLWSAGDTSLGARAQVGYYCESADSPSEAGPAIALYLRGACGSASAQGLASSACGSIFLIFSGRERVWLAAVTASM